MPRGTAPCCCSWWTTRRKTPTTLSRTSCERAPSASTTSTATARIAGSSPDGAGVTITSSRVGARRYCGSCSRSTKMPLQLRTELYAHQREAVRRARLNAVAFAHLAETGCGKTVAVLAEWQERLGPRDLLDLLVIAPAGSMRNWYVDRGEDDPCELRRHLDPRLYADMLIADNRSGAARSRAREKLLAERRLPRALFVNVEALSRGQRSKAETLCTEFLKSRRAM